MAHWRGMPSECACVDGLSMTWVEIAWTIMAAASLTLGFIHLSVWFVQRTRHAFLVFFLLAASVAAFSVFEMLAMRAQSPADYAVISRWCHVPLAVIALAILVFIRLYLGTGALWLAYGAGALRLLALVLNFSTGATVNFSEITELSQVALWGGAVVSVPIGVPSPWNFVPQISNVLLVAFIANASISAWRRGDPLDRARAARVGGALLVCIIAPALLAPLVITGVLRMPTIFTPAFFLVVMAMSFELGWDVARAARLADELRESELRTELAAQAAALAFWSWEPKRDQVWLSATGGDVFALNSADQVDLKTLLARVHPDDRGSLHDAIKASLRDCTAVEREFRIVLPDGRVRWIASRGQVELDHSGKPSLLRGVALDMTARRRLELESAQQRDELAHMSRVAMLGELSGSLAHEINQPLMAILSNAQAARRFLNVDNPDLDEVREILADIVNDDLRAGEVIKRLRAFVRKEEAKREPLDVNETVREVLQLVHNDLTNRGVSIAAELGSGLDDALGDRIQVQQVLLNLVMNACEAMDGMQSDRLVTIRTLCADGAGVEIAVSDRGKGVAVAERERIFEPFVTSKVNGMGLGLSICSTIVAAHGGRLWVDGDIGRGATFRFTLPRAEHAK